MAAAEEEEEVGLAGGGWEGAEEEENGGLNGAGFEGLGEIPVPCFGGLGSISMTSGLRGPF